MKIAVTGASSLIGSALIRYALSVGDEVLAIVRPNSKNLNKIPKGNVKIVECELKDYATFKTDERADILFHFAWDKTSVLGRDDVDTQILNATYTLGAVDLAKTLGCKKFVGAGSQAEYGIKSEALTPETPVNPLSGYGIAKYAAGKLSKIKAQALGLEHNWVRILSVYGIGDAKTTLISYLIDTFLKGETPDLTPCEQLWDYIYVDDAAKGLYLIGKSGVNGKTYPLGSGKGLPLKDYVNMVKDAVDSNLKVNFGAKEYYKNQPMYLVADNSELYLDTGFKAETDFKSGIKKTVEYMRKQ